jgi:membrane protein DedA with SNARE-associated domain
MYTGINHLHSFLRYAAVAMLLWTIIHAFLNRKNTQAIASKWSMISMMILHTQFLLGLVLWIMKFSALKGTPEFKLPDNRFFIMEHSTMMLLAIILISIGHIKGKKITDMAKRYNTIFWYFLIGFILLMVSIPWPIGFMDHNAGWF